MHKHTKKLIIYVYIKLFFHLYSLKVSLFSMLFKLQANENDIFFRSKLNNEKKNFENHQISGNIYAFEYSLLIVLDKIIVSDAVTLPKEPSGVIYRTKWLLDFRGLFTFRLELPKDETCSNSAL